MKVFLINIILKVWFKTIKVELPHQSLPSQAILGVWHQDLFAATICFKHLDLCCLISRSQEGDILTQVLTGPHMEIVRGSSSRGNLNVRQLIKAVKGNPTKSVIHALDGPRGPALVKKSGFEWLSQKTDLPKVIIHFEYSNIKRLNSWDKMKIPLPFSKIKVSYSYSTNNLTY